MKTYTEGSLRQELLTNNVEAFLAAIVANAIFQKQVKERAIRFALSHSNSSVEFVFIADPDELWTCESMLIGVSSALVSFRSEGAEGRVSVCTRKLTEDESKSIIGLLAHRWNVFI